MQPTTEMRGATKRFTFISNNKWRCKDYLCNKRQVLMQEMARVGPSARNMIILDT